jgi:hypothetical protein
MTGFPKLKFLIICFFLFFLMIGFELFSFLENFLIVLTFLPDYRVKKRIFNGRVLPFLSS